MPFDDLSPAIKALAAACFPELDWLAAEKAAYLYVAEKGLSEMNLEQVFIDQHKPCRCTCCGSIYLNGRLIADIVQEAIIDRAHAEFRRSQSQQ